MSPVDTRALARQLHEAIDGEVRFGSGSRALYATDASNYRQVPLGVVVPRTIDDVVATHKACRSHGAPVTCRGAGTSLSGETVNAAVVVDFSKHLCAVGEVDVERRLIRCQPGAVNDAVNEVAGRHRLRFGPDPSTHAYCTIGGNIGNNSCGVHSVQARLAGDGGRTSDNVHELEILTYDGARFRVGRGEENELDSIVSSGGRRGAIYAALRDLRDRYADLIRARFPDMPRRVSGYNLDELLPEKGFNVARALVGSEGTCATVLEATLNLIPDPSERVAVVIAYDDIATAGDCVPQVMEHGPIGCEAVDDLLVSNEERMGMHKEALARMPDGAAWLFVELGGESREEAEEKAHQLVRGLSRDGASGRGVRILKDPSEQEEVWKVREAGLGATAFPTDDPRDHHPGWEDSAVPPERVGGYVRDLRDLLVRHGYTAALYGHFGDGCIHSRIDFDFETADGIRRYRAFVEEAADLVVSYGGSLSGEHGDGQARGELLPRMFGEELVQAFREFKAIWDPDWRMNPGKLVDPLPLDEHLRLGTSYAPPSVEARFDYPADGGEFAHATIRCVGIGKCRTPGAVDVMCPSYVATREEMHSTRGRARLLFEMLQGEVVTDGWRSEEIHEALDLCLACKGCTGECPVNVDMPTYKAEFLSHFYARRLRPRHAYAFGLIDKAARLASVAPELTNFLARTEPFARALKAAAGIASERAVPTFAPVTLRRWFRDRGGARNPGGTPVVLWADTFNNYLHADVGVAAVEALEHAGCHVIVPQRHLCCGRPLYDYGMLGVAERYLSRVIDTLRAEIRAGVPIVGMEPSCVAVFRDELGKLLPDDHDAKRLAGNVYHFPEFFTSVADGYRPPKLEGKALVWGHCHQKATGGMASEHELLRRMGLDVEPLVGGCCGLAGSFGFEAGHYDISMACGEQALLPRVREAHPTELIVADGFSCTTQIEQGSAPRRALHVAEVMKLARETGTGRLPEYPERAKTGALGPPPTRRRRQVAAAAAVGLAVAGAARRMR